MDGAQKAAAIEALQWSPRPEPGERLSLAALDELAGKASMEPQA